MKVGVITMHRVINYGSVLQAYATQRILERLGYECEIIDYEYPNEFQFVRGVERPFGRTIKSRIAQYLKIRPYYVQKEKVDLFCKKHLHLSSYYANHDELMCNPPVYDIYMTGSDQTWNPLHMKGDEVFFLNFAPTNKKRVAFSASFTQKEIPEIYKDSYIGLLNKYSFISVREQNGRDIVRTLTGKDVPVTSDPTLMLSQNEWAELSMNERNKYSDKKYILLYMLSYAFNPAPYIYELLEFLQKKTGLMIYSFSSIPNDYRLKDVKVVDKSGPIEFLQLFQNASYVVTSSFHGTAFAVNFGKPLFSIVSAKEGVDDRQMTLLKELGILQCAVAKGTEFSSLSFEYDIEMMQLKLDEMRKRTEFYLKDALK